MNEQVEQFFARPGKWHEEFLLLREIIKENQSLVEEYKWMHPCYTFQGKNLVLIHGFKDYCALLFHKGALLKDPEGILIQQTKNVQAARQIRFKQVEEIAGLKAAIQDYIREAIELEKTGKEVEMKKVEDYPIPVEFRELLDKDQVFTKAFRALTPGRQKAHLFYFNQAKQAKTREARIEKCYPRILEGKGPDD
jgi:uncharacterized protein YdeI (YjbR/CyaY-like superfamily)